FQAARASAFDRWTRADTSAIDDLKKRIEDYQSQHARTPTLADLMVILAVGLGATGLSHFLADPLVAWIGTLPAEWRLQDYSLDSRFFWLVVFATTIGLAL